MDKDPFSHQIIGLAMKTHRELGPGLKEEFYHQKLVENLKESEIEHFSKPRRELIYHDKIVDTFEADIIFPGKLVVELKSLQNSFDGEHYTQVLCYCKFWRIATGMLFDFGKASLIHKRLIYTSKSASLQKIEIPSFVSNPELAQKLVGIAYRCVSDIGLGYRPTTWFTLMNAAMQEEGLQPVLNPTAMIANIGPTNLSCISINDLAAISIGALGNEVTAMERAQLQTCLKWLILPWGICFHFGKSTVDLTFVSHPNSKSQIH